MWGGSHNCTGYTYDHTSQSKPTHTRNHHQQLLTSDELELLCNVPLMLSQLEVEPLASLCVGGCVCVGGGVCACVCDTMKL